MKRVKHIKSLRRRGHELADPNNQLRVLGRLVAANPHWEPFGEKLAKHGHEPLLSASTEILQINMGKMCNQTCKHCHVDAGPDRKEIMSRALLETCLEKLERFDIPTVDLTGGAPEMNPHFRWFVSALHKLGKKVMVRCNLTIIVANPSYHDLPAFYKAHQVEVISSLPHFSSLRTDAQRGHGVFEASIKALRMLNAVGYGLENTDCKLHLVFNPSGAFLPGDQKALEKEFKQRLHQRFGIAFNSLFVITNMPIARFLEHLVLTDNLQAYMQSLVQAFNPAVLSGVMCRNTLSVSWDGYLYDCDFNQMLDLKIRKGEKPAHISTLEAALLEKRRIRTHEHCFGCTAGSGSSCGGSLAEA